MHASDPKKKEGRIIKALFWFMVAPVMFAVFIRLFFVLFSFIYAPAVAAVAGQGFENTLFILSALTALVFTLGVIGYTYRQLKKHIIDG